MEHTWIEEASGVSATLIDVEEVTLFAPRSLICSEVYLMKTGWFCIPHADHGTMRRLEFREQEGLIAWRWMRHDPVTNGSREPLRNDAQTATSEKA